MMGYRASGYESDTGSNDQDDGYTYINAPADYTGGAVTTTVTNMQITSGRLMDWDISALYNGSYDLRLFVLGEDDSNEIKVLDRATVNNITVNNPAGLYNLKANPNPFSTSVTITVNANTDTSNGVNFIITDSSGNTVTTLPGVNTQGVKYSAFWDASGQANGYYNVKVTAGASTKTLLMRKYSSVNNMTAEITTPAAAGAISNDIDVIGSAKVTDTAGNTIPVKMEYYELYKQVDGGGWTEVEKSDESVENDALGSVDMAGLNGDKLDLKLFVIDNAGNSKTVENDGITINFAATFTAGPLTYIRGGSIPVNFVYNINKDVDSAGIYIVNSSNNYVRNIKQTGGNLSRGSYTIAWNGTNNDGLDVDAGKYTAYMKLVKNNVTYTIPAIPIVINVCDALSDTAGASIDSADGTPRPYFDYTVTGSGMYDKPIPITYTVTGYATENWNSHPMIKVDNPPNAATSSCNGGTAHAYWPGSSGVTTNLPWNQTVTAWAERVYGNSDNVGVLWINGNSNELPSNGVGSSSNNGNYYILKTDNIGLEARAKKPDCWSTDEAKTWANLMHMKYDDTAAYDGVPGSFNGKDLLYYHRGTANIFAINIDVVHSSDYTEEPQHGVIASPFCSNINSTSSDLMHSSSDNGTRPTVSYNNPFVSGTLTGWGGNIIPMGENYFNSYTEASNSLNARSGNEKADGYQEGTLNTGAVMPDAISVSLTAEVNEKFSIQDPVLYTHSISGDMKESYTIIPSDTMNIYVSASTGGKYVNIKDKINANFYSRSEGGAWTLSGNSTGYANGVTIYSGTISNPKEWKIDYSLANVNDTNTYKLEISTDDPEQSVNKYIYLSLTGYGGVTETVIPLDDSSYNSSTGGVTTDIIIGKNSQSGKSVVLLDDKNGNEEIILSNSNLDTYTVSKDKAPYKLKIRGLSQYGYSNISAFAAYTKKEECKLVTSSNRSLDYIAIDDIWLKLSSAETIRSGGLSILKLQFGHYYLLEKGNEYTISNSSNITLPYSYSPEVESSFTNTINAKLNTPELGQSLTTTVSTNMEGFYTGGSITYKSVTVTQNYDGRDFAAVSLYNTSLSDSGLLSVDYSGRFCQDNFYPDSRWIFLSKPVLRF
jgi:flagellar hook assembly protein FlgD